MDDDHVCYKILNMTRDYFISADQCCLLNDTPKQIQIRYYSSMGKDLVSLTMRIKVDESTDALLISNEVNEQDFERYFLEKEL